MLPEPTARALTQPADMHRVGVKLFLAICDDWDLNEEERITLAGLRSRTTLQTWRHKLTADERIRLSPDTLERLSLVAGIRKAVELLFPRDQWTAYMRRPNSDLGTQSALDRMLAGRLIDLWDVRRYLDGQRGAHFA